MNANCHNILQFIDPYYTEAPYLKVGNSILNCFILVLVIGGGSPMNESDHLMTSLPPGTSGLTAN